MRMERILVGRRSILGLVVAALACGIGAAPAGADALKCERAIVKSASLFAQGRLKVLAKCEESKLKGKLPPATTCASDPTSATLMQKATDKLGAAIAKACGGDDKTCGSGNDDDALAALSWPSTCPDFEHAGCTNTIADCSGIAACLQCVNERAVDQAVELYYGSLVPSSPGSTLAKCQVAIGKSTAKFYAAKTKAIDTCWDGRLKGKHPDLCPDGTAALGSPAQKAAAAIAKAELKKIAAICKACGGPDGNCDGNADLGPSTIGFPATCPAVASCGGPVVTLADLVNCVDCVTEFKVDCSTTLGVPAFVAYPAECGGSVATPTPTVVPTITPTAVATGTATPSATRTASPTRTPTPLATVTPASTATRTPTPIATSTPAGAVCGNGTVESGEDCDDGNTFNCDSCPKNCKNVTAPVACASTSTRSTRQLQITAPAGSLLGGGSFCIDYPAGVVALPGTGNVPTGGTPPRLTGVNGLPTLNDFNNAVQLTFVINPGQAQLTPTISFDLCTGATPPTAAAFVCVTKTASDSGGVAIDRTTVQCTPQ